MANEYYDHGSFPGPNTRITSASMRAELDSIEAGFAKLPTLTGNGGKIIAVDAAGTALEAKTAGEAKSLLGLSNVNNTSDANKPISIATQSALDGKLDAAAASVFGRSLIDDADAAAARATLGLGTMATQAAANVAITGGSINGTTIGSTTPAAGSFTTLSATSTAGTPVLVQRTGSTGVYQQFLDSSGSSVYIGNSSGTFNVQTPSGGYSTKLAVSDSGVSVTGTLSASGYITTGSGLPGTHNIIAQTTDGGGNNMVLRVSGSSGDVGTLNGYPVNVIVAGATVGTFSSTGLSVNGNHTATGNVGIGTSSPEKKLHVVGPQNGTNESGATAFIGGEAVGEMRMYAGVNDAGNYGYIGAYEIGTAYRDLVLQPNGGNLGLGVTPSGWAVGYKSADIGLASFTSISTAAYMSSNGYDNGGWKYKSTAPSALYAQGTAGNHVWFTAPSGTAGQPIPFTQAMTLDASGKLAVGSTSAGAQLEVNGAGTLRLATSTNSSGFDFGFLAGTSDPSAYVYNRQNGPLILGTNNTERARIDSNGNLGIGVTPSAWSGIRSTQVGSGAAFSGGASFNDAFMSANVYYDGANWKRIGTNAAAYYAVGALGTHTWNIAGSAAAGTTVTFTQAMTMDASGNLWLGAKPGSTTYKLYVSRGGTAGTIAQFTDGTAQTFTVTSDASGIQIGNANNGYLSLQTNSTERTRIDSAGNLLLNTSNYAVSDSNSIMFNSVAGNSYFQHATGTASGTPYLNFEYAGAGIGSITQNGTTAVTYNTTSDGRLKKNRRPADAKRFMDVEFVDFEWVDGRHDCGVIADQLQSVYPDLVIGEKDATEIRRVEISPAIPAVTEQRLVSEAVLNDDGEEIEPAVYETVEIEPAKEAVYEEQEFPVYQQVNYMGLIGRMGARVQQLQRTVDAQADLIAAMEARLSALEAA